jgi:hypothetical protein
MWCGPDPHHLAAIDPHETGAFRQPVCRRHAGAQAIAAFDGDGNAVEAHERLAGNGDRAADMGLRAGIGLRAGVAMVRMRDGAERGLSEAVFYGIKLVEAEIVKVCEYVLAVDNIHIAQLALTCGAPQPGRWSD